MLFGLECHRAGFRKPGKRDVKLCLGCVDVTENVENRKRRSEYSKDLFYLFQFFVHDAHEKAEENMLFFYSLTLRSQNLGHNYTYLLLATLFL